MTFQRASGILLHPTSLPGPYGVGDLGAAAYRWLDFLTETGTGLWQVLPLNPTGYADSPYQAFSAFAGNFYLISPEKLRQDGLLSEADLETCPDFPDERVDYGALIPWKLALLQTAYQRHIESGVFVEEVAAFKLANAAWLDDFALFMALKETYDLVSWVHWPVALRDRDAAALQRARKNYAQSIARHIFYQFLFFRQWEQLRAYAAERQIKIVGDAPIYVAHDSADVWANPELFFLNERGNPTVVAGTPPDYFAATGQLWGNPLYSWDVHADSDYAWWIERMRFMFSTVDVLRLDHFRAFIGYWEVPGDHETAEHGRWMPGPGEAFFEALIAALGELPIIAEDLGDITPDVFALRDKFDLPGMKILQFAFNGDPTHPFLPHNYPENCVAYTGTHDNEPVASWYQNADAHYQGVAREYLNSDAEHIASDMVKSLWGSRAVMVLAPLQDLLGLGNESRMNIPGVTDGNWAWRFLPEMLDAALKDWLTGLNESTGRVIK